MAAASRIDPRRVLARHGLAREEVLGAELPRRSRACSARIVAAAARGADDVVVEIGAGLGTLTAALARASTRRRARIIAVERDPDMLRVLRPSSAASARVEIVAADALALRLRRGERARPGGPLVVVGNLPYQIASALVLALVEAGARGASRARS